MINIYLSGSLLNFNLTEIWFYFSAHVVFSMLFALHYFLFRILKYSNDKFNRVLKNSKEAELNRTLINTPKSIFYYNPLTEKRYSFYLSCCLKY